MAPFVPPVIWAPFVLPVIWAPFVPPVMWAPFVLPVIRAPFVPPVIWAPFVLPVIRAPFVLPVISAPVFHGLGIRQFNQLSTHPCLIRADRTHRYRADVRDWTRSPTFWLFDDIASNLCNVKATENNGFQFVPSSNLTHQRPRFSTGIVLNLFSTTCENISRLHRQRLYANIALVKIVKPVIWAPFYCRWYGTIGTTTAGNMTPFVPPVKWALFILMVIWHNSHCRWYGHQSPFVPPVICHHLWRLH